MAGSKVIVLFWGCWDGGGLFRTLFFPFFFCLVRGMMDGKLHLMSHMGDDAIGILE